MMSSPVHVWTSDEEWKCYRRIMNYGKVCAQYTSSNVFEKCYESLAHNYKCNNGSVLHCYDCVENGLGDAPIALIIISIVLGSAILFFILMICAICYRNKQNKRYEVMSEPAVAPPQRDDV